jgi:hypothetical protein
LTSFIQLCFDFIANDLVIGDNSKLVHLTTTIQGKVDGLVTYEEEVGSVVPDSEASRSKNSIIV